MGKAIPWELCKKFKFNHTNKRYMHNPESVLENKTRKILWDFEIQTDHLISARWPDQVIVNKKKCVCVCVCVWERERERERERVYRILDFAVPAYHRVKLKESEKRDKYLDLAWELKKIMEHERDGYTNCKLCTRYRY